MKIGELFIALGFDVDDKKLKEFKEDVKDGLEGLLKISAAAAGAVYAINAFVEGSIRSSVALRNFNTVTGLSIRQLQEWQLAGQMANTAMSVEEVTASVKALQGAIADVSMGKGPSGAFAMLGIDVRGKDAFSVLEEMRKNYAANVAKWGQTQTVSLMQQTGIDPNLINAIQITRAEFDKLYEGKMLSPDAQKKLIELGTKITDLKQRLSLMKDQISADWGDTLISWMEQVIPLLTQAGSGIKSIGVALVAIGEGMGPLKWFILYGSVALLGALYPVSAAFAAFGLVLMDIGNYLRGLPSITEDILDAFKDLADEINSIFDDPLTAIHDIWEGMKYIADFQKRSRETFSGTGGGADYDAIPPDFFKRIMQPVAPSLSDMSKTMYNNTNLVMHNLYNIHSVEDAFSVANQVRDTQQKQINYSFGDVNNGPRY